MSKEAISRVLRAEAEANALREKAREDAREKINACQQACEKEAENTVAKTVAELKARQEKVRERADALITQSREEAEADIEELRAVASDVENLFSHALKLFRHAGSESELDVLGKPFGYLAFALYVFCNVPASERNGCIMAHDVVLVYGYRGTSGSEINQCDSVLHLVRSQDRLGCRVCREIFLGSGDAGLAHHLVDSSKVASLADEYLEIAFEDITGHADDVVLYDLEILSVRE